MRLYQGNAKKLVGKKIDCYRRTGGYYPMEIIEIGGIPHVKDAGGVCMPIPEKEEDFNATNFDYAFQEVEVQENTMYQSLAYHQHEQNKTDDDAVMKRMFGAGVNGGKQ